MEEKVDILVATYNTKKEYLEKQLQSIIEQTYKNIHIYISDDCSTENETIEILKEYEKKDERITLILQEKNLGLNSNWEYLLKQSTAEYIMFSDHDDIWGKTKVEESVKKIKESQKDLIYVNCEQINQDEETLHKDYFKYKNVPLIKGTSNTAISRCIGIGCSQIITKKVKEKMLPFTKNVVAHDWLASFIANENGGIDYIKEPLFKYRLHSSNIFGGRSLEQNLGRWKKEHGKTYKSYLEYRKDAIDRAYLGGAIMELDYAKKPETKKYLENLIKYYEKLEKSKVINMHILKFFKFLSGKNLGKKMLKELILFHFPILGYAIYCII